jgi:hypothetical protein
MDTKAIIMLLFIVVLLVLTSTFGVDAGRTKIKVNKQFSGYQSSYSSGSNSNGYGSSSHSSESAVSEPEPPTINELLSIPVQWALEATSTAATAAWLVDNKLECFTKEISSYTYSLCLYGAVTQQVSASSTGAATDLGTWGEWVSSSAVGKWPNAAVGHVASASAPPSATTTASVKGEEGSGVVSPPPSSTTGVEDGAGGAAATEEVSESGDDETLDSARELLSVEVEVEGTAETLAEASVAAAPAEWQMRYTGGAHCTDGPARESWVRFVCNAAMEAPVLTDVAERTCAYYFTLSGAVFCGADLRYPAEALHQGVALPLSAKKDEQAMQRCVNLLYQHLLDPLHQNQVYSTFLEADARPWERNCRKWITDPDLSARASREEDSFQ